MPNADRVDFRLLGPVRVLRAGEGVGLGGLQRRALLALLLTRGNQVVPVRDIIDALWEDEPPAGAVGSVQVAVSGLRAALGGRGEGGGSQLRTISAGYQLSVEPTTVDFHRYRTYVDQGHQARASGDTGAAAATYRQALAQWSGRALQDLTDFRFAAELSVAWEEDRLACLDARIGVDLALGRHHEIVGELAGLVRGLPLREGIWAHYLMALYRCDRQAEALSAYREVRTNLADELGIEPGPALRELHSAILRQDAALAPSPGRRNDQATLTARELTSTLGGTLTLPDGRTVPVGSFVRLGRGDANQVVVDDPRASRQHAILAESARGFVLTDLTSTNGTRVNGELVLSPTPLMDGDVITIGSFQLVFGIVALR